METQTAERHEFQTEVRDLLHLMIHSLYSNREIFVRELVSNASDALDKLRFEAIATPSLLPSGTELKIEIEADAESKLLIVRDNGIGMDKSELSANLGTIARSGTREFARKLKESGQGGDVSQIGQFGVGFYSSFMVATLVEVTSRKAGSDEAWRWSSDGDGTFSIEPAAKAECGTEIKLYLKDEDEIRDFAQAWRLRSLVKKYSGFISHPVFVKESGKDPERLNDKPALWRRPAKDVTEEEYKEFFGATNPGEETPAAWSHTRVEGTTEFHCLLFVPSKAPFGIHHSEKAHGLKLYVKRVFIMDDCKDLLPPWLRFIRGVVDSEDLPLNVSREILQSNKVVSTIRKHVVRKALEMLAQFAKDKPEEYLAWWKELGVVLKEGFYMNWEHLDELKELLRFPSSKDSAKLVSLAEYMERMPEGQKEILWLAGENRTALERSPLLEKPRGLGYEVLFFIDPIDEFIAPSLGEYKEKKFQDLSHGFSGEGGKDSAEPAEEVKSRFAGAIESVAKVLGDKVASVRLTTRLSESASCLVAEEGAMSSRMEKLMDITGHGGQHSKRILELNPDHALVSRLPELVSGGASVDDLAEVLHSEALLSEGSALPDPGSFVSALNRLLAK